MSLVTAANFMIDAPIDTQAWRKLQSIPIGRNLQSHVICGKLRLPFFLAPGKFAAQNTGIQPEEFPRLIAPVVIAAVAFSGSFLDLAVVVAAAISLSLVGLKLWRQRGRNTADE